MREVLSRTSPLPTESDQADEVKAVGCILLPSDGMALFLFRGASEDLVRDRSENAEVPFDRVVESIYIGLGG